MLRAPRPALRLALLCAAAVLGAAPAACQQRAAAPAAGLRVSRVSSGGAEYLVAEADMRRVRLRMLSAGPRLRTLRHAEGVVATNGERLLLAVNGGLFDEGRPIGLHVEDGRTIRPLDLTARPPSPAKAGNYYFLPNAVLYQDRQGHVAIRDARLARGRADAVRDGLQSGPALLLGGVVHPIARPANRGAPHARRIAACVLSPDRLTIVFAEGPTTFPQLTAFLQQRLGCRDAVFLDAEITGIYLPSARVDLPARSFAGVLTLTERR
jgi:uncharacterized protein YigE (DUF2233 family)